MAVVKMRKLLKKKNKNPLCQSCILWQGGCKCGAFRGDIPDDILAGKVLHMSPYEGDNDFQYTMSPSLYAKTLAGGLTPPGECATCAYWDGMKNCRAFDGKIPADIWTGKVSHTKPYDGDGGEVYRKKIGLSMFDRWQLDATGVTGAWCFKCRNWKGGRQCAKMQEEIPLNVLGHVPTTGYKGPVDCEKFVEGESEYLKPLEE